MAQQLITDQGTLTTPGGYASWKVSSSASGSATNGILMLVGESDGGPDYTQEADLELNLFGPNSLSLVTAKYQSGPLVDTFRACAQPMLDADIPGSPLGFVLVKTNVSVKASGALPKNGGGTYGTLADKGYGVSGNNIYFTTTAQQAEVQPTSGSFTFLPPIAAFDMGVRVNGGVKTTYTAGAAQLPPAFVSGLAGAVAALAVSGGASRGVLPGVAGTVAVAVSGNNATFTYSATWGTAPTVGDTVYVPTGSAFAGAGSANCGSYVVTGATTNTITATKLMNASGSPGSLTPPVVVSATAVAATTDVQGFAPVTITLSSAGIIDGAGKALELAEETSNTDRFSNCAYALSATKVTWVSKTGAPQLLTSASEFIVSLNTNRQATSTSEQITAGGNIGMLIGYAGTTATATIQLTNGNTMLTTTVVGGVGANLSIKLSSYSTIADLCAFINAQAGYTATPATGASGQINPLALDESTFGICSEFAPTPGRIKYDAYDFFTQVSNQSVLVQLGAPNPAQSLAGLPAVTTAPATVFLAGGVRGGTTQAQVQAAIDALKAVDGNFLVTLFSQNATLDIAAGLTDSSSNYLIDSINAYGLTHVITMSQLKRRRFRQFLPSKRDTYLNAKAAAANQANFRSLMSFQDLKDIGANGAQQFQPYVTAAKLAAAQAAAFYKPVFFKQINAQGAVQAAGDFNPKNPDLVDDALKNGLAPIVFRKGVGWIWASDQNTYMKDNSTILNSFQAVYSSDYISRTCADTMEQAFVGQSFSDLTDAQVQTAFSVLMQDLISRKVVAKSKVMPLGYANVVVSFGNGSIQINADATVGTGVYFVKIGFQFQEVKSS